MIISGKKSDSVDYKQLSSYDDNLNISNRTNSDSTDKDNTDENEDNDFPDSTTNSKEEEEMVVDDYGGEQQSDDSATENNYGNDDSSVLASSSDDFFDDDDDYDAEYDDEDTTEKEKGDQSMSESRLEAGDQQQPSYANEEGSGGYESIYNKFRSNLYKNRFRLDFLEKYKTKHQKTQHKLLIDDDEDSGGGQDEDSDDEDDNEESDNRGVEGSGKFINDDEDDDSTFFSSKRKSSSRYFRKNANDAIKIISTPNGKVGIVYQQTDTVKEQSTGHTNKHAILPSVVTSNTERKSPIQKITPVLTPDGKVALLYRGASENTKYEPILNLSHTFNFDNKSNSVNSFKPDFDESEEELETSLPMTVPPTEEVITTTIPSPPKDFENSILPSINRPLSEVLGIKKNQFKQFRIKDLPTTTTSEPSVALATTIDLSRFSNTGQPRDFNYGFDITEYDDQNQRNNHLTPPRSSDIRMSDSSLMEPTKTTAELISKSEVVNLAIIPHFDENFERQQRFHEPETRRHHRQRHRHRHLNQDLSNIHCIMQAMMGVAAVSTVFGMLGALFKQRILDQIRLMHW